MGSSYVYRNRMRGSGFDSRPNQAKFIGGVFRCVLLPAHYYAQNVSIHTQKKINDTMRSENYQKI